MEKKKKSKTKSAIRNSIFAFIANLFVIGIGLVSQKIFIEILGTEYLGINGLFTNIISMLGIVELGLGSAIIYNLYDPIVKGEENKIKALMNFYKKSYNIVGIIVFVLGMLIIPLIPLFVDINSIQADVNLNLVYVLFIVDIVFSYFMSYKRSILYADQKNYIVNIFHVIALVLMNAIQIVVLLLTKNYYIYLVVKIIMRVAENVAITLYVNHKYKFLKGKNEEKLDEKTKGDIIKKVKALFFHKVGSFIVLGTDNLIISKFLGVITVGLYSNYYMIIYAVQTMFGGLISAVTPSVGNLLVEKNKEKNFQVFRKVRFINFIVASLTAIAILVLTKPFITLWLGEDFVLPKLVLLVLVINYFQSMMRLTYNSFKDAAGIFYEDRFVPLVESIINIIASIVLLQFFGLAGVFMGTIVSSLALWCFSYPKFVYKKMFERKYLNYAIETIGYFGLFILVVLGIYYAII